jgi:hypothetical protein
MSNIAEGFERGTKQELLNFLFIAKGSAGEVRAQLYVAYDIGYLNEEKFKILKNKAEEVSRLIYSLIKKIKQSGFTGLQYKHSIKQDDWAKQELKKIDPERYRMLYGDK